MYFTEIGYKLGQKQVRGGGVTQLCGLLEKLESVFPFHFYCEYKKIQNRVPASENKFMNRTKWEMKIVLIAVGFTKLINFLSIPYWNFNSYTIISVGLYIPEIPKAKSNSCIFITWQTFIFLVKVLYLLV